MLEFLRLEAKEWNLDRYLLKFLNFLYFSMLHVFNTLLHIKVSKKSIKIPSLFLIFLFS